MQPINFSPIDYSRLGQRSDQYTANIGQGIKQLGTDISNGWQQYLANQHQKEVWDNQLAQQERQNKIQDDELAYQKKLREEQEAIKKQKLDAMRRTKAAIKGMYSSPDGNVSTNGNPDSTASLNDFDGDYIMPQGAEQLPDGSVDYNGNNYSKEGIEAGNYPDLFQKKPIEENVPDNVKKERLSYMGGKPTMLGYLDHPEIREDSYKSRIQTLRADPNFWKKTPEERRQAFIDAGMKWGEDNQAEQNPNIKQQMYGDKPAEAQTQEPPDVENFDDVLQSVSKYGMPAQLALLSYLNNEDPDQDASLLGAFSNAISMHDQNEALNAGKREEEARTASDKAIQAAYSDNQVLRDIRRGNIGKTSADVTAQMDAIDGLRGQVMQISDPYLRTQLLQDIDQQWGKLKPIQKGKSSQESLKAFLAKQKGSMATYNGVRYYKNPITGEWAPAKKR